MAHDEIPHPQGPLVFPACLPDPQGQFLTLLEDPSGLGKAHLPLRGQGGRPPRTDQQGATQLLLQAPDGPAQGGLGHVACLGRLGKIPVLSHGDEIFQGLQGHGGQFLPFRVWGIYSSVAFAPVGRRIYSTLAVILSMIPEEANFAAWAMAFLMA